MGDPASLDDNERIPDRVAPEPSISVPFLIKRRG
jgi:hypothetical protein